MSGSRSGEVFKVGDFVFAKIRGHPPWPAIITAVNKPKIEVKFYGTDQIGYLSNTQIFPYLKFKFKYVSEKMLEKSDFSAGISGLEMDLLHKQVRRNTLQRTKNKTSNHTKEIVQTASQSNAVELHEPKISNQHCDRMAEQPNQETAAKSSSVISREKMIQIEETLVDLNRRIKISLQNDFSFPQLTLNLLKNLKDLEVTPVILKKNTECVLTVKKISNHVGYMAKDLRWIANIILIQFAKLFDTSEEEFWDVFSQEVTIFRDRTRFLTPNELENLYDESVREPRKQNYKYLIQSDDVEYSNNV